MFRGARGVGGGNNSGSTNMGGGLLSGIGESILGSPARGAEDREGTGSRNDEGGSISPFLKLYVI